MQILKQVHCRIRKGTGPQMVDRTIDICLDDIEQGTPESMINDMVKREAILYFKQRDCPVVIVKEIYSI